MRNSPSRGTSAKVVGGPRVRSKIDTTLRQRRHKGEKSNLFYESFLTQKGDKKEIIRHWVWWSTPVFPALGKPMWKDGEFEASYTGRPVSKQNIR